MDVKFKVAGQNYYTRVAVTEVTDEFILGIDFLTKESCQWDFGGSRILVGNSWVKLQKREAQDQVRSIYAVDTYEVPPGVQADVPVSMTWPKLQVQSGDWVTEPRCVGEGVIAARTLLSGNSYHTAVRVINLSDETVVVNKDAKLGEARLAEVCEADDSPDVEVPDRCYQHVAMPSDTPDQPVGDGSDSTPSDLPAEERQEGDLYSHLRCLIDGLPTLTKSQQQRAKKLCS